MRVLKMKKKESLNEVRATRGATITEVMVTLAIILTAITVIASLFINNRKFTEARAVDNANLFIEEHSITVDRMTCAGDSDGDGYGTCVIKTGDGEKIKLLCPVTWVDVNLWGVVACKEDITVVEGLR